MTFIINWNNFIYLFISVFVIQEDWALFLITKKRTTKLKMTEFDENFSDDYAEGTEVRLLKKTSLLRLPSRVGRVRLNWG